MAFGLLILRLVLGLTMAAHGAQKAFGLFGGYGLEGTGGWLESLGFRPGAVHARVVAASELVGGLLLAVGLLTPFGAAAIIGVMLVAIATVHLKSGFFNTEGGYEFNLLLATAAATLAFTGPGRFSIDSALGFDMGSIAMGFTAIALGVLGAIVTLAIRSEAPSAATDATDTGVAEDTEVIVVDLAEEERAKQRTGADL